jgi:crotonobetainyl-CoA:carnitine CoA-transferase CaiB-like acyl-CoA transferase
MTGKVARSLGRGELEPLADLIGQLGLTGHFAAAGMMAALHRHAIEGGSYQVKLSLARGAMWVQELGLLDAAAQAEVPETDSYPAETS